jgi:Flp pilus assembly CpaF family ATPase
VALEAREPNTEGEGAVSMSSLVRRALRMDPDRVIVGEVLGDEVIDMLNAMSQGNDGSLCTMHANSSEAVFRRLCTYAIQAPERLAPEATNLLTAGAITFVVFIAMVNEQGQKYRNEGGGLLRFVHSIREVVGAQGLEVHSREVFRPGGDGRAVPGDPIGCLADLVRNGYDPRNFEQKEGFWQ